MDEEFGGRSDEEDEDEDDPEDVETEFDSTVAYYERKLGIFEPDLFLWMRYEKEPETPTCMELDTHFTEAWDSPLYFPDEDYWALYQVWPDTKMWLDALFCPDLVNFIKDYISN
jgi:hypothetical protein